MLKYSRVGLDLVLCKILVFLLHNLFYFVFKTEQLKLEI